LLRAAPRTTLRRSPVSLPIARSFSMSSAAANSSIWAEKPSKPLEEYNTYLATLPDFEEGSKRCAYFPAAWLSGNR
jgi:hypothetical protein